MGQAAAALYTRFVEEEDGLGRDFSAMLPRFETSRDPKIRNLYKLHIGFL